VGVRSRHEGVGSRSDQVRWPWDRDVGRVDGIERAIPRADDDCHQRRRALAHPGGAHRLNSRARRHVEPVLGAAVAAPLEGARLPDMSVRAGDIPEHSARQGNRHARQIRGVC